MTGIDGSFDTGRWVVGFLLATLLIIVAIASFSIWQDVRQRQREGDRERCIAEQTREAEKVRRKREGLRPRGSTDKKVAVSNWDTKWNLGGCRWLEGERRELLPGDIVLEWGFDSPALAVGGYAIERTGRIVAEVTTFHAENLSGLSGSPKKG